MQRASDYLVFVKSALISCPYVTDIQIVRDESVAERGLYRYRITLKNGGLLDVCERFIVQDGEVRVTKYRFHWQDANGLLQKRWDNAAHHQSLETFPSVSVAREPTASCPLRPRDGGRLCDCRSVHRNSR